MSDRVLSSDVAARLIYNTPQPSAAQIERVKEKIERGALPRSPRGGCTTTASGVAAYLSQKAAATAAHGRPDTRRYSDGAPVPGFYKDLLKDYFMAILLQRTARKRTQAFNYAVTACQVALIVLPLVVAVFTYRGALAAFTKSPAQVAVEQYLSESYDEFRIESLQPMPDSDAIVRAKFWYVEKGSKRIESERYFSVSDGRAVHVNLGD